MDRLLRKVAAVAVGIGASISLAQSTLYTVDPGHRAVIFDRFQGIKNKVVGEGTHFRLPWVQTPIIYDVRTRPRQISTVTGSKDLQTVSITLRVLHKPDIKKLPLIHKHIGYDYDEKILPSIGNEVMKAVVAQYNAEDLITKRESISKKISAELRVRANQFHLFLDDVSITHLSFGREFTRAVESKQVAQQEAERSKFIVQKAEQEKLASIIRAEGESASAALIAEAMRSGPGLVELRRIEAAKEIAELLSRARNVVYLPSSNNFLMNLPTN